MFTVVATIANTAAAYGPPRNTRYKSDAPRIRSEKVAPPASAATNPTVTTIQATTRVHATAIVFDVERRLSIPVIKPPGLRPAVPAPGFFRRVIKTSRAARTRSSVTPSTTTAPQTTSGTKLPSTEVVVASTSPGMNEIMSHHQPACPLASLLWAALG